MGYGSLFCKGGSKGRKTEGDMINLAGKKDCDTFIAEELKIAKIELVHIPRSTKEVAASITGKLGEFTFHRAWYYWVAQGPMPLSAARELHAHPDAQKTVRVAGHCGCPPPEAPWITWRDHEGNEIVPMNQKAQIDKFIEKGHIKPEQMKGRRFDEHPENFQGFIESYHIDSQLGLCLFADKIRELASVPAILEP